MGHPQVESVLQPTLSPEEGEEDGAPEIERPRLSKEIRVA